LLAEAVAGAENVSLLDLEKLAAYYGKARAVDWKLHYMGGIEFSPGFQELVAAKCLTFIRLVRRAARKCLVLDLDNTLWGGVVGEEGAGGIALAPSGAGSEYVAFQREIKRLAGRGVVLALNSKNNPEDAAEVLEGHPHMVLRATDFAAARINWEDKATNLREIAAELNIGTESLVFLDDSPVERGWVRQQMPEVLVPELPGDPALLAPFLEELDVFEVPVLTAEDRRRGEMYAEGAKRRQLESSAGSLDDYIRQLNVRLRVAPASEKTLARCCQMIAKTNQFNLTTRRHSEARVAEFAKAADSEIWTLNVSDVYGDSGITGLAILCYADERCTVDTLLLSCRVLGRRVEDSFLAVMAEMAARRAPRMIGEYVPTKKNAQTADFYSRHGFEACGAADEVQRFELDLGAGLPARCELHQIVVED
jgi:FkbH-like protein